jgi:hypothetical protein
MRQSLARFSGPESSPQIRSLADFIATTSGFSFSVHTTLTCGFKLFVTIFRHCVVYRLINFVFGSGTSTKRRVGYPQDDFVAQQIARVTSRGSGVCLAKSDESRWPERQGQYLRGDQCDCPTSSARIILRYRHANPSHGRCVCFDRSIDAGVSSEPVRPARRAYPAPDQSGGDFSTTGLSGLSSSRNLSSMPWIADLTSSGPRSLMSVCW